MSIDAYMWFQAYESDAYQVSESQVSDKANPNDKFWSVNDYGFKTAQGKNALFEVEDFSFDVEQTLNIGSQSSGSGAGRITFNPFSITRKIDIFSPTLFQLACSGTPFQKVALGARKAAGGDTSGAIYLVFMFRLVAVKTIAWSYDDESPKETVTFEYGGLQVHYAQQLANGKFGNIKSSGWNRVKNIREMEPSAPAYGTTAL